MHSPYPFKSFKVIVVVSRARAQIPLLSGTQQLVDFQNLWLQLASPLPNVEIILPVPPDFSYEICQ